MNATTAEVDLTKSVFKSKLPGSVSEKPHLTMADSLEMRMVRLICGAIFSPGVQIRLSKPMTNS